jgi:NADH-quinone oxidoreductase subunit L
MLSLMGLPFYAGYYSKDIIIYGSSYTYVWSDLFLSWISNISILLTTLYSTKLLYLVFMKEVRANKSTIFKVGEGSKLTYIPLIMLGFPSISLGYFGSQPCVIASSYF